VAQIGPHEEGPRPAGAQRAAADLLGRAPDGRGDGQEGAAEEGEEAHEAVGEEEEEIGGQRGGRRRRGPLEEDLQAGPFQHREHPLLGRPAKPKRIEMKPFSLPTKPSKASPSRSFSIRLKYKVADTNFLSRT